MGSKTKVIKVRSWDELPEVVGPGAYIVDGVKIRVYEEVKDFVCMAVKGVKELHRKHYAS